MLQVLAVYAQLMSIIIIIFFFLALNGTPSLAERHPSCCNISDYFHYAVSPSFQFSDITVTKYDMPPTTALLP